MATKFIAPSFTAFDIYKTVFGYRAIAFPEGLANTAARFTLNPSERLSKLGAVLFKRDANGTESFCPVTLSYKGKDYELPYSTIAITMQKNIQKTALPGRQGTVKELIQIEDFQFTIQGIMLGSQYEGEEDFYLPETALGELNELFRINEPVQLKNAFAEIFMQQDNTVVIESVDLPDMKGVDGAQAYSIRVLSDTILELEE